MVLSSKGLRSTTTHFSNQATSSDIGQSLWLVPRFNSNNTLIGSQHLLVFWCDNNNTCDMSMLSMQFYAIARGRSIITFVRPPQPATVTAVTALMVAVSASTAMSPVAASIVTKATAHLHQSTGTTQQCQYHLIQHHLNAPTTEGNLIYSEVLQPQRESTVGSNTPQHQRELSHTTSGCITCWTQREAFVSNSTPWTQRELLHLVQDK